MKIEIGITGIPITRILTDEITSELQKITRTVVSTKIMMNTVIIEEEGVEVVVKENLEEGKVLALNLTDEGKVNPKKTDTKTSTLGLVPHIIGTSGDVVEVGVEVVLITRGETLEFPLQAGLNEVKTPGTVLLKAAEGTLDVIPQPASTTAEPTPLFGTPECSEGTQPLPGVAEAP